MAVNRSPSPRSAPPPPLWGISIHSLLILSLCFISSLAVKNNAVNVWAQVVLSFQMTPVGPIPGVHFPCRKVRRSLVMLAGTSQGTYGCRARLTLPGRPWRSLWSLPPGVRPAPALVCVCARVRTRARPSLSANPASLPRSPARRPGSESPRAESRPLVPPFPAPLLSSYRKLAQLFVQKYPVFLCSN